MSETSISPHRTKFVRFTQKAHKKRANAPQQVIQSEPLEKGHCCPICHELPINPVRWVVEQNNGCCPHMFCHACVVQMLYHSQNTGFRDLRCPVCRREVYLPKDSSVLSCFTEDKIVEKLLEDMYPQQVLKCKYCDVACKDKKELQKHQSYESGKCNACIHKCSNYGCNTLGTRAELQAHNNRCKYNNHIICDMCGKAVYGSASNMVEHIITVHSCTKIFANKMVKQCLEFAARAN